MIPEAYIIYRSKEPVHKKPAVFSTGGYAVETPDKKTIIFDWISFYANTNILEDGRIEIRATLDGFDTEFTDDSSDEGTNTKTLTAKELTSMTLTEVTYDCYADTAEEEFIALDVVEFMIEKENEYGEYHSFKDLSQINK